MSSYDGNVFLWDARKEAAAGILFGAKNAAGAVAFSHDGKTLASGSGRDVRLWHVRTRREIMSRSYRGPVDAVVEIAFSPDGQFMTVATRRDDTQLWLAPHVELSGLNSPETDDGVSF